MGNTGIGELVIEGDGAAESGFDFIGRYAGSEGTVRISSRGLWNNTQLHVGSTGNGAVFIDSGRQVRTAGGGLDSPTDIGSEEVVIPTLH